MSTPVNAKESASGGPPSPGRDATDAPHSAIERAGERSPTSGPAIPVLRVTDIKQAAYCPRIPYWSYLAPSERRLPAKVRYGAEDHALLAELERRRTLCDYGLRSGSRRFHLPLSSERWGLAGKLDALLETNEERIPVEYKDTLGGVRHNHRLQLAAYALILRDHPGPPVRRGMVFLIPEERAISVTITPRLLKEVLARLTEIRTALQQERLPPPPDRWSKCRDCEYLRLCGDRFPPSSQTG